MEILDFNANKKNAIQKKFFEVIKYFGYKYFRLYGRMKRLYFFKDRFSAMNTECKDWLRVGAKCFTMYELDGIINFEDLNLKAIYRF